MRRDRTLVGKRCIGCTKVFKTSYSFDQHRRSGYLRGTACYSIVESIPAKTRSNLYAVKRRNMSTATLQECQETAFRRSRGLTRNDIFCILYIFHCFFTYSVYCIKLKSQSRPHRCGKAGFEITYFRYFYFYLFIDIFFGGGVYNLQRSHFPERKVETGQHFNNFSSVVAKVFFPVWRKPLI
jgi:hypothetical protein